MKQYKARSGEIQWKPSIEEAESMDDNNEGFCLACGEVEPGVEPDAVRYKCSVCDKEKVYGAAELALRGLVYTGDAEVSFTRYTPEGLPVEYEDAADASEHRLRMMEGGF